MPSVAVIIPYRGGCPHRQRALQLVARWWAERHPEWQLIVATDGTGVPWRKAVAVAHGAQEADADVLVVADADLVPFGVGEAVTALGRGEPWVFAFRTAYRLTESATDALAEAGTPPVESQLDSYTRHVRYVGKPGGGCVVLPAETWRRVPMDPRFGGWGHEDLSWALALSALAGAPWRCTRPAAHLWHPRAPRLRADVGSTENLALWTRYRTAASRPLMAALVAEARDALASMVVPAAS